MSKRCTRVIARQHSSRTPVYGWMYRTLSVACALREEQEDAAQSVRGAAIEAAIEIAIEIERC